MAEYDSGADDNDNTTQAPLNLAEPWRREFDQYLTGHDEVPDGMSLPQWWGVRYCNLLFIQLTFNDQSNY
jgi:hypothetical protein